MGIVLKKIPIKSNTVYTLNTDSNSIATYEYKCDNGSFCYYQTNAKYTGQLTITKFDTLNKIVSGKFSFKNIFNKAQADCNCDTSIMEITDGRFDLKYY